MNTAPKYQVVHDEILARLQSGQYAIGMRLPTEGALARAFDVSRVTVRKSLEMLVRAGYLTSRQGSGYSVATLSPPASTCLVSFTDKVLIEGRTPGAKLLRIETPARDVPAAVAAYFDEPLVLVERLRTVDGQPRMLTQTWMPQRLVPQIRAAQFPETGQNQSILRILREEFGLDWTSACETLNSLLATASVSNVLAVPVNTPILSQACTAFDKDNRPVFFDLVYRQGPISFDLAGPARRQTA
ncbi:GntR family transcriptional regulator [uncultured Ruegeria sp.]|uniref:GntR family transcriptional regulator n=1 Tax=uncultured Ruegeria sp. TaxID=259304 RepID=UPI00261D8166|nr:GntR family transcriptional regulator [uncultured Ruegeria sp.]